MLAGQEGWLLELLFTVAKSSFPQHAPEPWLTELATGRNLRRFSGEAPQLFRERILGALDFWRLGGTELGMRLALLRLGYLANITPVRLYDPLRWSQFDVYLYPYTRSYDGSIEERQQILSLINEIKPAHTRLNSLLYVPGVGITWNPSGLTWNPPGLTWGEPPIMLYP